MLQLRLVDGGAELYTALAALKSFEGRESEAAVLIKVLQCLVYRCTSVLLSCHLYGAH